MLENSLFLQSWNGLGEKDPLNVTQSNLPAMKRDIFNQIRAQSPIQPDLEISQVPCKGKNDRKYWGNNPNKNLKFSF